MNTATETGKLLESILPKERIKSRLIDLAAYAPDAGFYYLRPKAVVQPVNEDEIKALFKFSQQNNLPLTFRTGGTSLSGQAISDGILVDLSKFWTVHKVENEGLQIRVQPGMIGATANAYLKKYNRKIGPDPASINAAMMGGILSNNSSGMCCGVTRNSYHTTKYIRFILPNGKAYTTEWKEDYQRFKIECPELYQTIELLRQEIISQPYLYNRIRQKYQTKNTVGYSVNAFIDYEEPLDILAHLLIGAEGTLAFISEAVLETVPDFPFRSTALLYFPQIFEACKAIIPLSNAGAEAVELMDRASLHSVAHIAGLPEQIKFLPENAAALLVEFQGSSRGEVEAKVNAFLAHTTNLNLLNEPEFTEDPYNQALYWKVRKGLFPSVGAVRASGTSVILEDIAFPVALLGDAVLDLHQLFKKYGYNDAIIFGHAKDGNLHFVVTQTFNVAEEVERYDRFLREVVDVVVKKYNGTLKAEHGTGRNMAPFVETEWGPEIYRIMKMLKEAVDPHNLLNPGVIINEKSNAHVLHLKAMPGVEREVDKCMECGFCEHRCPSRNLTLTPRQRIVIRRELATLKENGNTKQHNELLQQYRYDGMDTCAVDGLCATACPVDINTGSLIKRLRKESHNALSNKLALTAAKNFGLLSSVIKGGLRAGNGVNGLLGKSTLHRFTKTVKKVVPAMPLWSNQLKPTVTDYKKFDANKSADAATAVVYFPTCINRVMGGSSDGRKSAIDAFVSVSEKAGINFLMPNDINTSCCGQPFSSKGYNEAFAYMANQTVEKLWKWTKEGKLPVVLDITSCTHTLQHCAWALSEQNKERFALLKILDSIDYLADYILPRLQIQKKENIAVHPVCSLVHMGLETKFLSVAKSLAHQVTVPVHAGCCGMAGDRGFLFPELTQSATRPEAAELKEGRYDGFYSTAKTCEMAMSDAVGADYHSLLHLADECSSAPAAESGK
ncbi:FAD-binding and (Fe-S)-binding domain-containing protein [Flavisolibacter ginsenosidimutans]|uniref:D-lactate dehydrogenase (cytochrome) n=1 Tax=Flavisolibacter ginsenosidimutans TaxID=661481 RepID=A0A5B8UCT3_9BACT|nr:FAD-binding and (Fe-S)-binding domain-containing protein [Flavisolibacter ginsenosidimutans]QEC54364.1 FAD-binding oxidoreductase [Flavisolibacter ginsenosidimutans]